MEWGNHHRKIFKLLAKTPHLYGRSNILSVRVAAMFVDIIQGILKGEVSLYH
jgi:hypothetical protein